MELPLIAVRYVACLFYPEEPLHLVNMKFIQLNVKEDIRILSLLKDDKEVEVSLLLLWQPNYNRSKTSCLSLLLSDVSIPRGALHNLTYGGGGWLKGLSKKPQNIHPKIAILKKC